MAIANRYEARKSLEELSEWTFNMDEGCCMNEDRKICFQAVPPLTIMVAESSS
jgi:hypothetical protein